MQDLCVQSASPSSADAPPAAADAPSAADAAPAVDARDTVQVTVMKRASGNGDGSIITTVPGLSCATGCSSASMMVKVGTSVMLTATADQASFFSGWSAPCVGPVRTCVVEVTDDITLGAEFRMHLNNLAFVTSTAYDGQLGGLAGADEKCRAAATSAGLAGKYVAALAIDGLSIAERLVRPDIVPTSPSAGWVRLDGRTVAGPATQIATSDHHVVFPVLFDENGVERAGPVWSGANEDGDSAGSSLTCGDWSTTIGTGAIGHAGGGGPLWSFGVSSCGDKNRLLCLGVDRRNAASMPSDLGFQIYLTKGVFAPQDGLEAADALCVAERPAGAGPVRALLAASGRRPSDMLISGVDYVRPDSVSVGNTAEIMAGKLLTGIWVHGDETHAGSVSVWTGSSSITATGSDCDNWSSSSGMGEIGAPVVGSSFWLVPGTRSCGLAAPIYCVESDK